MHRVSCYEEQYSIEYSICSKVIAAEFFMVEEKKNRWSDLSFNFNVGIRSFLYQKSANLCDIIFSTVLP